MPVARRNWKSTIGLLAVFVFSFSSSGCDSAPGTADLGNRPPVLSDLVFSPDSLDLSTIDPGMIVDGNVVINLTMQVSALDANGDIGDVVFTLLPPQQTTEAIASGILTTTDGVQYSASETLSLPSGQIGNYTLVVFASDSRGQLSNQVRGSLELATSGSFGSPPVIELLEATPQVFAPPSTLKVVATVSDAEGLSNILQVTITILGQRFAMADDGESVGDDVAGDGKFTASFDISSADPGDQVLTVQAFDRNGNESEPMDITITIQ